MDHTITVEEVISVVCRNGVGVRTISQVASLNIRRSTIESLGGKFVLDGDPVSEEQEVLLDPQSFVESIHKRSEDGVLKPFPHERHEGSYSNATHDPEEWTGQDMESISDGADNAWYD
jgi:hypothetical protein